MEARFGIYDPKLLRKVVFNISYIPNRGYNIEKHFFDVEGGHFIKKIVIKKYMLFIHNPTYWHWTKMNFFDNKFVFYAYFRFGSVKFRKAKQF